MTTIFGRRIEKAIAVWAMVIAGILLLFHGWTFLEGIFMKVLFWIVTLARILAIVLFILAWKMWYRWR